MTALQHFIDRIEENLQNEFNIDQEIIATAISKFHFYRLFKAITGYSVQEYIKMRKIVHASQQIIMGCDNLLELALSYGFQSHEVFIRNFKKVFQCTPTAFKHQASRIPNLQAKQKVDLEAIHLEIKSMNGKTKVHETYGYIEHMRLIGIERISDDTQVHTIFPFIESFLTRVNEIQTMTQPVLFRVCHDIDSSGEIPVFKELIAVEVSDFHHVPAGMVMKEIRGLHYVNFTYRGKLLDGSDYPILNSYQTIYGYRLPASGIQLTSEYFIETYGEDFHGPYHPESQINIWMSMEKIN